jgi:carboxypeptidase-like protein/TonB-dependent receptor-like protein
MKQILLVIIVFFTGSIFAQQTGSLAGRVTDIDTKAPVPNVSIIIQELEQGIYANDKGQFYISDLPVGSYSVAFQIIGYQTQIKTDIIIKSNRTTYLNGKLKRAALIIEGISAKIEYFAEIEDQSTSSVNFSNEEIRRSPGSAGDVSRILMSLPSVAKVNDQSNNLVIRGGSPIENTFYIDNIEIPNINHFPTQGASGGPIGMINVELLQDVNFYTGGFSALYGDRLSSIMELSFREGNRREFDGQLDLNFAGFGGVFEGPLFSERGSWIISARRSYLDFLVKHIEVGTSVAPIYGDIQSKIVFDLNKNHQLSFISVFGDDHSEADSEVAVENDMLNYGEHNVYQSTLGMNWRALWNNRSYSNTSVSFMSTRFKIDSWEIGSDRHIFRNRSTDGALSLRNVNYCKFNDSNSIEFGLEAKYLNSNYDNFYAEYNNPFDPEEIIPAVYVDDEISSGKVGTYINYKLIPTSRSVFNLGLRADHFFYNKNTTISPRISFSYALSDKTKLKGSGGIFSQSLPLVLLSQNDKFIDLKEPRAIHYIIGLEHMLSADTRLTMEVYRKDYDNFPLDPEQPDAFIIDEAYYQSGYMLNHDELFDTGKARSEGVELMIQKKLATDFYGLASCAYFKTRYRDLNGKWRDRIFDNRIVASIEGGYKPNYLWEFSCRWLYAGGVPYTPFDKDLSTQFNQGIYDTSQLNAKRYPDYHSLNVRFDRRFHFNTSNLVFYLSIWNAYGQKNIATYYWNQAENKKDVIYQWTMLPIFGLEYEF